MASGATPVVSLPPFEAFLLHGGPAETASRWKKWLRRFEILLTAMAISDDDQKRALLLHYAGGDVEEIFEHINILSTPQTYDAAKSSLTNHFAPACNTDYETLVFRNAKQQAEETMDQYHTRLRRLSSTCGFTNADREIKIQILHGCSSSSLRTKFLREPKLTLTDILALARAHELSVSQSKEIETSSGCHIPFSKPIFSLTQKPTASRTSYRSGRTPSTKCGLCGGNYPHQNGRQGCPAFNKTCLNCGKTGHFAKCCRSANQSFPQKSESSNKPSRSRNKQTQPQALRQSCDKSKDKRILNQVQDTTVGFASDDSIFSLMTPPHEEADDSVSTVVSCKDTRTSSVSEERFSANATVIIPIGNINILWIMDTGSSVNVINQSTYESITPRPMLSKPDKSIFTYSSSKPLKSLGSFTAELTHRNQTVHAQVLVIPNLGGNTQPILGLQTCERLGLIIIVNSITSSTQTILSKYPGIFTGVGKLKDKLIKLHINPLITPIAQSARRVPFHLREPLDQELKQMEQNGIIEKATGPTPWISPLVLVPKPQHNPSAPKGLRVCVDMRAPNSAIIRERYPTPTIDDIVSTLNGCKIFSTLDLRSGYHQLELDPSSRYITTFASHNGLYRYRRLNFGISSASEVFQHSIREVISGIVRTLNIADDIIIGGIDQADHDATLDKVLQAISESGLTLNADKCAFNQSSLSFYGMIIGSDGIRLDPSKVSALKDATPPKTAKEVRSFLGMVTFCARFLPHYSTIAEPLRRLTKTNEQFVWGPAQSDAFERIKSELCSERSLAFFDPNLPTELYTDASPVGLAAILMQMDKDRKRKVVAYASHALTATECKYSQIEKEALGVVWGCEKFHVYLFGKPFTIITDHKPLEFVFNTTNPHSPARIERWRLRIQRYDYVTRYERGIDNPADFLSRSPHQDQTPYKESSMGDLYALHVLHRSVPKAMTLLQVIQATEDDSTLQQAIKLLPFSEWNFPKNAPHTPELEKLKSVKTELSLVNGILLRGSRIVLPASLRPLAIDLAHEGHQGSTKSKQLLRSKVWFPRMDDMVERKVNDCLACQTTGPPPDRDPLIPSPLPDHPWQSVSLDFAGPLPTSEYLLVLVDDFSRFPIVEIVRSTSGDRVIPILKRIFSTFGIPQKVRSDNGPPFNGLEFSAFSTELGFCHRRITPLWPQANGLVERLNRTLKKSLQTSSVENSDWRDSIHQFLLNYRSTPHSSTGFAPATIFFGRAIQSKLPQVTVDSALSTTLPKLRLNDAHAKARMKHHADKNLSRPRMPFNVGDRVLVKTRKQNKLSPVFAPDPLRITKMKGSMLTASNYHRTITRNQCFFKHFRGHAPDDMHHDDAFDDFQPPPRPPQPVPVRGEVREERVPNSPPVQDPHVQEERRYPLRLNRRPPRFLIDEML